MKRHSEPEDTAPSLREKIIGLGERSIRKSYYPQLRQQLEEAEASRRYLEERSAALLNMLEDLEEARRSLADSQARYRSLVENISDVIFSLDVEGKVTYVSPVIHSLSGLAPEQIIGQPFSELVNSDDQPSVSVVFERTMAGRSEQHEFRLLHTEGGSRYVRASSRPLIEEGRVVGLTGVMSDITERKQAEEALRVSEEKYREIFDNVSDSLFVFDVTDDGRFRFAGINATAERVGGVSDEAACGKYFEDVVRPEQVAQALPNFRRCIEKGEPLHYEEAYSRPAGNWYLDTSLVPVRDDTGRITRLIVVSRDITERKLAEEALRASQQRLALHLEQTLLGVIEWDTDFRVTEWNPAAEAIFGFSSAEVIGHNASDLILAKARRPEIDALFDHLVQQKASEFSTGENATKDGRTILCEWVNTPLVDQSGTVVGGMSLARDITERRQAEELRIAKEAAEAANVAKSGFLANMSHEIRTPMNAILGFAQLLRRDPGLSERQRQQVDTINSSGEHLLALVNDVLEMAKIESGRVTLNPTAFDLYALVDDLETLFSVQADEKGLALHFIRSRDVPRFVVADESRLRQVFVNLLGNAVKFTEKGSVTLRVGVRHQEGGALHLLAEVEDTGPGIAPEELDRLFQYFEQAGAGRRSESGTGLGLAISRGFVHLLGGEITVHSEVGKGSVFSFDVAVEETSEETAAAGAGERHVIGLQAGEQRRRVLVADDAPDNRELLVQLLEPVGFDVKAVSDGKQAVREFRSWHPDVVLMDMRMPVMDGYEATRRIRATSAGAHVPIIGVTASVFSEMRHEVFAAGVDDFLGKPFSDSELFDKIRRLLGLHYVYEAEAATPEPEEVGALSVAAVAALPSDLVDRIRRATVAADFDAVLYLADEVERTDHQLAAALRNLAGAFDSDRILAALPGGEKT